MPKRGGKVWMGGVGWVSKREEADRDYSGYENDSWAFLISFWRWYPDQLLDLLRKPDAKYPNEELIQRVMMRAFARYQYVDITGCRSLTKTNTKMKQKLVWNILWPGTKSSYYGPSYTQQSELAKTAFADIEEDYPALTAHWRVDNEGKDNWGISTRFGSSLTINAIRGKNIHDVTAEEYAQEEPPPFDFEEYTTVVLYAVRLLHRVEGKPDPTFIPYQQHSITSAGRKQNHSYETRVKHLAAMRQGKSAFVMDVPWQVIVLSQMRPLSWALGRREESTAEKWMREMESRYSGTDQNPIVRDEVLTESRSLMAMEEHHCCKDRDNKLNPEDVIYIVGYDVSYADGKANAKCACVVVKCTKQKEWFKRDKYLKQIVWVDDWGPGDPMAQAQKLKSIWYRYCFEGSETYIAIDAWQYGTAVTQALMMDLGDGLAPLCTYEHRQFTEFERDGALPVIYPIKAGGVGAADPDSEMIRNAEMQFEHRNVQLLTANRNAGIEAYKRLHRIRDDAMDAVIDRPYRKTTELCGQISNLKKVVSGVGFSEKRISRNIQRDSWSAAKYALRMAQVLEAKYLVETRHKSDWDAEIAKYRDAAKSLAAQSGGGSGTVTPRRVTPRRGGKRF